MWLLYGSCSSVYRSVLSRMFKTAKCRRTKADVDVSLRWNIQHAIGYGCIVLLAQYEGWAKSYEF